MRDSTARTRVLRDLSHHLNPGRSASSTFFPTTSGRSSFTSNSTRDVRHQVQERGPMFCPLRASRCQDRTAFLGIKAMRSLFDKAQSSVWRVRGTREDVRTLHVCQTGERRYVSFICHNAFLHGPTPLLKLRSIVSTASVLAVGTSQLGAVCPTIAESDRRTNSTWANRDSNFSRHPLPDWKRSTSVRHLTRDIIGPPLIRKLLPTFAQSTKACRFFQFNLARNLQAVSRHGGEPCLRPELNAVWRAGGRMPGT